MSSHTPDVRSFLPSGAAGASHTLDHHHDIEMQASDIKKPSVEHVEHLDDKLSDDGRPLPHAFTYEADDDVKPRTGLRKLLRRNPSVEFMREVATISATEGPLDQAAIKEVERKIFWLIVPALFVCYGFYCRSCSRCFIERADIDLTL